MLANYQILPNDSILPFTDPSFQQLVTGLPQDLAITDAWMSSNRTHLGKICWATFKSCLCFAVDARYSGSSWDSQNLGTHGSISNEHGYSAPILRGWSFPQNRRGLFRVPSTLRNRYRNLSASVLRSLTFDRFRCRNWNWTAMSILALGASHFHRKEWCLSESTSWRRCSS